MHGRVYEFRYDDEQRKEAERGVAVAPRLFRVRTECGECGGLHENAGHRCEDCERELGVND